MVTNRLKLLIVDDEFTERNLLKLCINWQKLNIEIVGEASNANEAFEMVEKFSPDIIFTDIKMPFIDGIQFSEIIHMKFPNIKIVVISGISSFEFAQKSIKIGVADYILKPIIDDEVLSTVMNLKQQIEQERNKLAYETELRKEFFDSLPLMRQKFLNDIIDGKVLIDDIKNKLFTLGLSFGKLDSFQTAVIRIKVLDENPVLNDFNTSCLENIFEKISDFFSSFRDVIIFKDNFKRIVILNCDAMLDLVEPCSSLNRLLKKMPGISFNIGIGAKRSSLNEIVQSYKDACEAKNYTRKSNDIMTRIMEYVYDNIGNYQLSLSSVAKAFYLNPSYLSRIFKKETGENFVNYLLKLRIEKARRLLMETDMKAFEISEAVGFSNPNYFCTCFKKHTGLSASEYKKLIP